LTEASSARPPASARFINPETLHPPFGYSHVVEVTAGRPSTSPGRSPWTRPGRSPAPTTSAPRPGRCSTTSALPSRRSEQGFEQVVNLNLNLVDATHLPVIREVRDQYVNTRQPPASTAVEVQGLFREDPLVEVEAVAVIAPTEPSGR
jgi:endoribonuclease L-PSP